MKSGECDCEWGHFAKCRCERGGGFAACCHPHKLSSVCEGEGEEFSSSQKHPIVDRGLAQEVRKRHLILAARA